MEIEGVSSRFFDQERETFDEASGIMKSLIICGVYYAFVCVMYKTYEYIYTFYIHMYIKQRHSASVCERYDTGLLRIYIM